MRVLDLGSSVDEWQTLHAVSSTLDTSPGVPPSLVSELHPLMNAAIDNATPNNIADFLILIAFLLQLFFD